MTVTALRQSRIAWNAVVLIMFTTASWSAGSLLRAEERTPIAREPEAPRAESDDPSSCRGGTERIAEIHVFPDAVYSNSLAERVEYHAEISVRRGASVGVAWTGEVVDDLGRLVQADVVSGTESCGAGDVAVTNMIQADLEDGYYRMQVRAAVAKQGSAVDMVVGHQYLHIQNGRWYELDDLEWREQSRATLTRTSAELRGGR